MIVLYILLGLIALILITALLVGTGWTYEKSIVINASPDKVWLHTNTLAANNAWSPWIEKDPNIKQQMSGTDGTPGATYSWQSDEKSVGEGSQTITGVTEKSSFNSRVDFIKPFKGTGNASVLLTPEGSGTKVTWRMVSSTPYPMNIIKIFGVIEKNLDKDFTVGLGKLKRLCE